ncbi:hypothetical protein L1049_024670 [Liquidambar formosana]|uniref:PGG domain-containing protein n=1 Tax=Liquidambar formosana TaxID=63359 RepID=A0AAP0X1G0_LIQFO
MELKRPITEISKSNTRTRSTLDLLLVATLVATVTFAAGFTMPGGLENSGRNQGMATLVAKHAFHAFLICNPISTYSSITAAVALIWAHLGDLNLVLAALNFSLPLVGIALTMISLTFMAGVYLEVRNLPWLAMDICSDHAWAQSSSSFRWHSLFHSFCQFPSTIKLHSTSSTITYV